MIHYIYKIIFLRGYPTGRYYIGKRSFYGKDLNNDPYTGSGNFCKTYFKKYGAVLGDTYLKDILEINPSKIVNENREIVVIGDSWKTDPLCMNMCPGGNCGGILRDVRKIDQYSIDGSFIRTWNNADEIQKTLNIHSGSILEICKNTKPTRHTAGGYRWCYNGDILKDPNYKKNFNGIRKVSKYDLKGNFIAKYDSLKEAASSVNGTWQTIQRCCNGKRISTHGFIWCFDDEKPSKRALKKVAEQKSIIVQIDSNGDVVHTFNTIKEAVEKTGFSWASIQNASNKGKWSCGYLWKRIYID